MKKYVLIATLCALSGACQPAAHSLIKVSWEQDGYDCLYKESFGEIRNEWNLVKFENREYVGSIKEIKYGNTPCSKIIDAELKNNTNKSAITNQFH